MAYTGLCLDKQQNNNLRLFVNEVGKNAVLYDRKHKDRKDMMLKKNLWTSIGLKFGVSGEKAEKKWRVQRDRYTKERKKINDSMKADSGCSETYTPTWYLFPVLDDIFKPRAERLLLSCMKPDDTIDSNPLEEDDLDLIVEDCHDHMNELGSYSDQEIERSVTPSICRPSSTSTLHILKETIPDRTEIIDPVNSCSKTTSASDHGIMKSSQPDIISKFCDYLEERLRGLDKADRREVMHKTEMLLIEKESQDKYL